MRIESLVVALTLLGLATFSFAAVTSDFTRFAPEPEALGLIAGAAIAWAIVRSKKAKLDGDWGGAMSIQKVFIALLLACMPVSGFAARTLDTSFTPEPETLGLIAGAAIAWAILRWKKRK